jgi:large subunit ribosomal protein L13
VLEGKNKPVYHPMNDCGDHVVVVNSKHVALLGE